MKPVHLLFLLLAFARTSAQTPFVYNVVVDVQHYNFKLAVNDDNDTLRGTGTITVRYRQAAQNFVLDLAGIKANGKGMMVSALSENGDGLKYEHVSDKLNIKLNTVAKSGEVHTYTIQYKGIPADGLIYSKNKYGHRTIFADNWPNRAHNWIPCVDHPSDKASVEYEITAPEHYQVVANGMLIEESNLPDHKRLTHWKEHVELPVKVMAIGIADFAVGFAGEVNHIPVYSWVFPEDREKGFYDYKQATEILPFYIRNIGPYAYKKLANVQSKTRFGGMENASAIFYSESSITGTHRSEDLLAHEIAHQWFGNSVTEIDWPHLWLSEGFATYLTDLYMESKYGRDTLIAMLSDQRQKIIDFSKRRNTAVVDATATDQMELLNANSYEKGGWVLHMLRRKIGDLLFWKGISAYYAAFNGKNANTDDFRSAMEKASGRDLKAFFKQWLYTPGQPKAEVLWKYDDAKKSLQLTVAQKGTVFSFPLEIGIGNTVKTVTVKGSAGHYEFPLKSKPSKIVLDPNTNLLFEGSIKEH